MYMYMYIWCIIVFVMVCMKSCLPTNCDNVVSCIKTLSLCRVQYVSVPPILSYINLKVVVQRNKMWGCYCLQIVVCCGLKRNCEDAVMCS